MRASDAVQVFVWPNPLVPLTSLLVFKDAYLACSPVIAITGKESHVNQLRHAYQEVDHRNPFGAVTKYTADVHAVDLLPVYLRQAFRSATTGTPGPVHLDLQGLAGQVVVEAEADFEVVIESAFSHIPPFRPAAEPELITEALSLLSQAQKPIIMAGGGVTTSDASAELIALAEKLSIPVATSLNAKAMFPADHELAIGTPGSYSRACANQAMFETDLVFFIGSHTGGQVTNGYKVPPQGTPIIQLDINAEELGRNYPLTFGLQGDVRNTLRLMIDQASKAEPRTQWIARIHELVNAWKEDMAKHVNSDTEPMRPERLCKELSDFLPSDAILVSDTDTPASGPAPCSTSNIPHNLISAVLVHSAGFPRSPRCQMRRTRPSRHLLHWRWGHLVSHDRTRHRHEIRNQHRYRHQQQPFAEPGNKVV